MRAVSGQGKRHVSVETVSETMGVVDEAGSKSELSAGDRVVLPFPIACGHCSMCSRGLVAHCETTRVREHGSGAAPF